MFTPAAATLIDTLRPPALYLYLAEHLQVSSMRLLAAVAAVAAASQYVQRAQAVDQALSDG